MSRAVYTVSKGGVEIARLEALIWVRLTAPGLYLVCGEDEGEGVLVGGEWTLRQESNGMKSRGK